MEPLRRDPDARGYFGEFGGRYVPETIMAALDELGVEPSEETSRLRRRLRSS